MPLLIFFNDALEAVLDHSARHLLLAEPLLRVRHCKVDDDVLDGDDVRQVSRCHFEVHVALRRGIPFVVRALHVKHDSRAFILADGRLARTLQIQVNHLTSVRVDTRFRDRNVGRSPLDERHGTDAMGFGVSGLPYSVEQDLGYGATMTVLPYIGGEVYQEEEEDDAPRTYKTHCHHTFSPPPNLCRSFCRPTPCRPPTPRRRTKPSPPAIGRAVGVVPPPSTNAAPSRVIRAVW